MNRIYVVTVHGRRLESRDLRKLLSRAVAEKRIMDQRLRLTASLRGRLLPPTVDNLSGSRCATETVVV